MNQKGKKQSVKKRVVPFLNYTVRNFSDYNEISDMAETQKIIFDNLVEAINFSVSKNKNQADIFKLNEDVCVTLEKEKWATSLKKAIEFYSSTEVEDYEKCKQCRDIIEKITL
jgi:hypothetical protein